jgi:hypothetical protein
MNLIREKIPALWPKFNPKSLKFNDFSSGHYKTKIKNLPLPMYLNLCCKYVTILQNIGCFTTLFILKDLKMK